MQVPEYKVLFYESQRGQCYVNEFLATLSVKVQGKVSRWVRALRVQGPNLERPYADVVRGKIRELRVTFASQQYRLLYFFAGKYIVVTHGFIKKTPAIPEQELERAEHLMQEWCRRFQGGSS